MRIINNADIESNSIIKTNIEDPIETNKIWHNLNEAFIRIKQRIIHAIKYQNLNNLIITPIADLKNLKEISYKLALSIAYTGEYKILLIDCNLNDAKTYLKNSHSHIKGLNELVHHKIGINQALQKTESPNLFILNSGSQESLASNLYEMVHFNELIKIFEAVFDLVLLDTPSINISDDVLTLANRLNSSVLLVYTNHSAEESIRMAYQKLANYEINVLSA